MHLTTGDETRPVRAFWDSHASAGGMIVLFVPTLRRDGVLTIGRKAAEDRARSLLRQNPACRQETPHVEEEAGEGLRALWIDFDTLGRGHTRFAQVMVGSAQKRFLDSEIDGPPSAYMEHASYVTPRW